MVRRMDVLLVDDDEEVLRANAELLQTMHDVRAVNGFREAMRELVRRVPDAVISDLELPPYRGDAFLQIVARSYPGVRRVLYTGSLAVEYARLKGVAHKVLLKPASLSELLAAIGGDV
jgi:DNA-binding NtrC family response regulator